MDTHGCDQDRMASDRRNPTARTVLTGELAERGSWVVACVEPQISWPTSVQKLTYRGQTIFVLPQFDDCYPSIAMRLGEGISTRHDARILIFNLLSGLCWVQGRGALVEYWAGGNMPVPMGGFTRSGINILLTDYFRVHYIPDIADEKTRWALAFYREGLSIRHTPYAFLSFYKIINILHKSGKKQESWIENNIDTAAGHGVKERLQEIRSKHNVGQYLYESGRCAVAHAGHGLTVDPENPLDLERLAQDLPLIRDLAAYAIEFEFGVKSSTTVYREHLYEIEGFRSLVGESICQKLKTLQAVGLEELFPIPSLHVGLWGEQDYPSLRNLVVKQIAIAGGVICLECASESNRTRILLGLNFANERLFVDTIDRLTSLDDGTEAAVRDAIEVEGFRKAYFNNGELMVKRADTGELMGRCDPFVPTNVDMGATLRNFQASIDHLTKMAEERRAKPLA
jgi:Methylamine utilization protein MauJ